MEKLSYRTILYGLKGYLPIILLFWLAASFALSEWGYEGSFIHLNSKFHSGTTDKISWLFTHLADGILLPLIILLFMWKKDKALVITALILILGTGAVGQIMKRSLFKSWDRPTIVLAREPNVHFVPEHPEKHNSFPSGHATSFAAGGLAFAWFFRRYAFIFQSFIALFTIALTYTRVHLGVHFLGDIFAGTLLGTLLGLVLFKFTYPPLSKWIEDRESGLWEPWENYILIGATLLAVLRFVQKAFF